MSVEDHLSYTVHKLANSERNNRRLEETVKNLSNLLWNYSRQIEKLESEIKELKANERETKV